jgi:hypothetical protein
MRPGIVYRHQSCLDVDILVSWTGQLVHKPQSIQAGVRYWNRHYKIFQGEFEIVNIKIEDLYKWKEVPNETPVRPAD